jgi:hypothetical protein
MHCHSTASQLSRLGVQRSLGLPECATPPLEVYELAKRWGMDFVTITDHDTIDGCLELADRPDCFVSEELTARFAGEPQAVHVLCYGITPGDHEWLQAHADDVETCAAYLAENEIASALAHPFYSVDAALTPRHRRRLAELFPVWEVRNGSRAAELNMPAWTSAAPSPRCPRPPRRKSFSTTCAAARPKQAANRAAPPSGLTRQWHWPRARSYFPVPVRLMDLEGAKGAPERLIRRRC